MIPVRLTTIILLIYSLSAFSQKVIQVDGKTRVINYYVLRHHENGGFFRKNQELPRIVIEAALNAQLASYLFDYRTGEETLLTLSDLEEALRKVDEPTNKSTYSPDEMALIGIDLTEGYQDSVKFHQFNYLNLYIPYLYSATTTNIYLCSFRFNEVLALLDQNEVLWYPESFGLSNGIFTNYSGFTLDQTRWAKKLLEAVKYGFSGASFSESANISTYDASNGYDVEIHLSETKENSQYTLNAVEIHKSRHELEDEEASFICSIPAAEYRDYVKHLESDKIKLMSEVLLNQVMTRPSETWQNKYENFYDSNFKDREFISKDGKYLSGEMKDMLSAGNKLEVKETNLKVRNERFFIKQTETIDLSAEANKSLRNMMLIQDILTAASAGRLNAYVSDSLKTKMTGIECDLADFRIIELIYEVGFDHLGDNKTYHFNGMGIPIGNEKIGFFRYDDLKEMLPIDYLKTLRNRNFKGFVKKSSHISIDGR